MQAAFYQQLDRTAAPNRRLWKAGAVGAHSPAIHLADGREVFNFCANNYLDPA
jgi:7-keto-8-aminopelargonate synthetase-like enzyme